MIKCNGRCETGKFISRVWICSHNNLEINRPHLIPEWHPDNKIPMSHYTVSSRKKVLWKCSKNTCGCHEWYASIRDRTRLDKPRGCPFCVNQKLCIHNNLEAIHPELITEWHPGNNPMSLYAPNSNKKVKWICSKNTCGCHIWEDSITHRANKKNPRGCPFCVNKQLCVHNNLEATHPELITEWHPDNNPMSLYPPNSGKKVKWICSKNTCSCHIWNAVIQSRTKSENPNGCPFCTNYQLCDHNNLQVLRPELIAEWHSDNHPMSLYPPSSGKKVKWICSKNNNHIWDTLISDRTKIDPTGCPQCANSGYSKSQIKWLTEIENKEGIYIQHFCKEGEYKIPDIGKVDGYCKETNTIYEFNGSFWHGDPRKYDRNDINPKSKKTYGELYDKTLEKEQKIRDIGYNLVVMWEIDYLNLDV